MLITGKYEQSTKVYLHSKVLPSEFSTQTVVKPAVHIIGF